MVVMEGGGFGGYNNGGGGYGGGGDGGEYDGHGREDPRGTEWC